MAEAKALQNQLALVEWGLAKFAINGTKWVVAERLGYPVTSAHCRRPYPQFTNDENKKWLLDRVSILDPVEQKLMDRDGL